MFSIINHRDYGHLFLLDKGNHERGLFIHLNYSSKLLLNLIATPKGKVNICVYVYTHMYIYKTHKVNYSAILIWVCFGGNILI